MGPDLVEEGTAFTLGIGIGPFRIDAPCRVVYTLDDTADRSGFAYGTLVGHPERGEARFELTHDEGQAARFASGSQRFPDLPPCWLDSGER